MDADEVDDLAGAQGDAGDDGRGVLTREVPDASVHQRQPGVQVDAVVGPRDPLHGMGHRRKYGLQGLVPPGIGLHREEEVRLDPPDGLDQGAGLTVPELHVGDHHGQPALGGTGIDPQAPSWQIRPKHPRIDREGNRHEGQRRRCRPRGLLEEEQEAEADREQSDGEGQAREGEQADPPPLGGHQRDQARGREDHREDEERVADEDLTGGPARVGHSRAAAPRPSRRRGRRAT